MDDQNITYAWGSLWTKPRKTIRHMINTDPHKNVFWLAVCYGILSGLYWIETLSQARENMHIALVYSLCIIVGAAYGVGMFYLISWIYTFCGKWLGGTGKYNEVKCAVGWSYYPFIIAGLIALVSYYISPIPWIQAIFALASTVVFIWGMVILFKVIAEAHNFGAWKGVGSVVIALIIVFGVMTILSWLSAIIYNTYSIQ